MTRRSLFLIWLVSALALAQPLVGTYKGEMGGRSQTLVLSTNRNAQLTTTFSNGKASIVQKGTWKSSGQLVTLNFSTKNNASSYETIVFQVDDGELVATQYNVKNWGPNGLVLNRWESTPNQPASQRPVIDSLLVSPTRTLKVGETLTVVMTGTPGCQASFDILGSATDVLMSEVSPGRYQANLTLTKGMAVREAVLVARLSQDGQEVQKDASRSITIEAVASTPTPPMSELNLLPARESRVFTGRPEIGVTFPGRVVLGDYRLWLDGAEVTGYAQINQNFLYYVPRADLSQGRHTVRLLGPGTDEQWSFVVAGARVTPSPADGSTTTGYRPRIQAAFGQPVQTGSIRLWLDQSEVTGSTRMSSYDASYQPNFDLSPGPHRVRVTARNAGGETVDYSWGFEVGASGSNQPEQLWVTVTAPANYAKVPPSFTLQGRATASMIVEVHGTITAAVIPGVIGVKTQQQEFSVYARPDGYWELPVTFPGSNGSRMDLTVICKDSYGSASSPIKVSYVLKK